MKKQVFLVIALIGAVIILFTHCENEEENQNPTCSIIYPTTGSKIPKDTLITIKVTGKDRDGKINQGLLYLDDNLIESSSTFPIEHELNTKDLSTGSHIISAKAIDNEGAEGEDTVQISVGYFPVAGFSANTTIINQEGTIHFMDESTGNPTSWEWSFGDGGMATEQNPSHTYQSAGVYTVELTISNDYGSCKSTKKDYIIVKLIDVDGNIYNVVKIGNQTWMAENLRVTHYADGTPIPEIIENEDWQSLGEDNRAYCWYDNDSIANAEIYGALYTWSTAMDGEKSSNDNPSNIQGVCPDGWHLPSDQEWSELVQYIRNDGHSGSEGNALKASSGWRRDGNGTDDYGFKGLPGGLRNDTGPFGTIGFSGFWWTSTRYRNDLCYFRRLYCYSDKLARTAYEKIWGFSVRCLKDNPESIIIQEKKK